MASEEDLDLNLFFTSVKLNFPSIYRDVVENGWLLCVPVSSSLLLLTERDINEDLIKEHILQSNFCNLLGRPYTLDKDTLKSCGRATRVLSQETVYTIGEKLQVLYVESPLTPVKDVASPSPKHCSKFSQKSYIKSLKKVKKIMWQYYVTDREFTKLTDLQNCIADVGQAIKALDSPLQNYVIYHVYKQLMDLITIVHVREDVMLNRINSSLADTDAASLGIPAHLEVGLMHARHDFGKIAERKTSSGKLGCMKKAVEALCMETGARLTADEFLSIFTYLVIKSNINNWSAQLFYMRDFSFSLDSRDEELYYLATLEAAIQWLLTERVVVRDASSLQVSEDLFNLARAGDAERISLYLQETLQGVCHPLCVCDSCKLTMARPSIDSLDESGFSALHYACMNGHSDATQLLLRFASTEVRDYGLRTPLHLAVARGHQTCVLLMCHQYCDLNAKDDEHNTPLHLASQNGQESCVKALLYYAEHARVPVDLNAQNKLGETPLHLAAKGGFWNAARVLLQWKADKTLKNGSGLTASQVAQNLILSRKISSYEQPDGKSKHDKSSTLKFWNTLQRQFSFARRSKT